MPITGAVIHKTASAMQNEREALLQKVLHSDVRYRTKTRGDLVRISAAVMGIEFCYAAETAFVSPILLSIGK